MRSKTLHKLGGAETKSINALLQQFHEGPFLYRVLPYYAALGEFPTDCFVVFLVASWETNFPYYFGFSGNMLYGSDIKVGGFMFIMYLAIDG